MAPRRWCLGAICEIYVVMATVSVITVPSSKIKIGRRFFGLISLYRSGKPFSLIISTRTSSNSAWISRSRICARNEQVAGEYHSWSIVAGVLRAQMIASNKSTRMIRGNSVMFKKFKRDVAGNEASAALAKSGASIFSSSRFNALDAQHAHWCIVLPTLSSLRKNYRG